MRPSRLGLVVLLVACGSRTQLGGGEGGPPEIPPCGAGFSCPPPGTWYDCMPPLQPAQADVCEGACHDYIAASCPGVGFAY